MLLCTKLPNIDLNNTEIDSNNESDVLYQVFEMSLNNMVRQSTRLKSFKTCNTIIYSSVSNQIDNTIIGWKEITLHSR